MSMRQHSGFLEFMFCSGRVRWSTLPGTPVLVHVPAGTCTGVHTSLYAREAGDGTRTGIYDIAQGA